MTLLEAISATVDFDSLGYENVFNNIECAALQLHDEVVKHDRRNLTTAKKFQEAVMGLPSYISIPFYNDEITNLMYAIGHDKSEDIVDKYWNEVGEILATAFANVRILKSDGVVKFIGNENDCYMKLQRLQGQSADYAMKYGGWSIHRA